MSCPEMSVHNYQYTLHNIPKHDGPITCDVQDLTVVTTAEILPDYMASHSKRHSCSIIMLTTACHRSVLSSIQPIHALTHFFNTLRTGDADLRFYITTVQDR